MTAYGVVSSFTACEVSITQVIKAYKSVDVHFAVGQRSSPSFTDVGQGVLWSKHTHQTVQQPDVVVEPAKAVIQIAPSELPPVVPWL